LVCFNCLPVVSIIESEAQTEFSRILRPGGIFAPIWNLEDRERASWVAQVRDTYEPFEGDTPQYRLNTWRGVFDVPIYSERFDPHKEFHVTRSIPTTEQGVVDRVLSKSFVTNLGTQEQAQIEAKVREVVKKGDGRVWIDKEKGIFGACVAKLPLICSYCHCCQRVPLRDRSVHNPEEAVDVFTSNGRSSVSCYYLFYVTLPPNNAPASSYTDATRQSYSRG
jgi:hypothetical protein